MRTLFATQLLASVIALVPVEVLAQDDLEEPKKATKAPELALDETSNATTVKAAVGTTLVIRLYGNKTTGYRWEVSKKTDGLFAEPSEAYEPKEHADRVVGSGGAFIFKFPVQKAGRGEVTLVYRRPWEKDAAPAKTYLLTVEASEP